MDNWIRKKKDSKKAYGNILKDICDILDDNPSNSTINCLKDNLPPLKIRIVYFSDKILIGFFFFNYHIPYSSEQKIKNQLPIHSNLIQTQNREMTCSAIFYDRFYVWADIFEGQFCATANTIKINIFKYQKR